MSAPVPTWGRGPALVAVLLAGAACEPAWVGYASHACALLGDGTVQCWGYDSRGQLGDGTTIDRATPVTVAGLPAAVSVAAGQGFSCAGAADGRVFCWGRNDRGQLGDGTLLERAVPAEVAGVAGATRVVAGRSAACAMLPSETWCWGSLGCSPPLAPGPVAGLPGPASDLAVGESVACGVFAGGATWCWDASHAPAPQPFGPAVAVTVTWDGPCAVLAGGQVSCATGLPAAAVALSSSGPQACALLADGTAWCWGDDRFGPPSGPFHEPAPFAPAPFLTGVAALSVGSGFACAVRTGGTVDCWGDNWGGQLGDGTDVTRLASAPVTGLAGPVTAVAAARGMIVYDYGMGTAATPGEEFCW